MNEIINQIKDLSQEILELENLLQGNHFAIINVETSDSFQTHIKINEPEFNLVKEVLKKKRARLINKLKELNNQIK